jgi:hypothetical protein
MSWLYSITPKISLHISDITSPAVSTCNRKVKGTRLQTIEHIIERKYIMNFFAVLFVKLFLPVQHAESSNL